MIDLRKYFNRAYVINLDIRDDKWDSFLSRAGKLNIVGFERVSAIEGDKCPPPAWWRSGNGAWGCLMSHLRIAQDALMQGLDNYLVFEDDVCFSEDFVERLPILCSRLETLDQGWDMFYLGGQHLYLETSPPWFFRNGIVRCNNVNRTHAFAVNAQFMVKFCQHIIHAPDYIEDPNDIHIDHQLGNIHRQYITLAAQPWLCGQAGGSSNINGQMKDEEWWHDNGWGK